MKIIEITLAEGLKMIELYHEGKTQLGSYIFREGKGWTGIDAQSPEIFVQDFPDRETCEAWLRYELELH
jgi:hypothetical protein